MKNMNKFLPLLPLIKKAFKLTGNANELLKWILGDGKKTFINEFEEMLSTIEMNNKNFETRVWVKRKSDTAILVNTDKRPEAYNDLFCTHSTKKILSHSGSGWINVEINEDTLYVNNRKVLLRSTTNYEVKNISELHTKLAKLRKTVLNATIMDALNKFECLIPSNWKWCRIFFLGTIFQSEYNTAKYVHYMKYFRGNFTEGYNVGTFPMKDKDIPAGACVALLED